MGRTKANSNAYFRGARGRVDLGVNGGYQPVPIIHIFLDSTTCRIYRF